MSKTLSYCDVKRRGFHGLNSFHLAIWQFGSCAQDQNRPTKEFSGGWRMRIALAQSLFAWSLRAFWVCTGESYRKIKETRFNLEWLQSS